MKTLSNGSLKIVKKKQQKATVSQNVIIQTKTTKGSSIPDTKCPAEENKKLKKRYKALQQDIYVDNVDELSQDDSLESPQEAPPQQKPKQVFLQPQQVLQHR